MAEQTYRFRFSSEHRSAAQYVRAGDPVEALKRATALARTNWPPRTKITLEQVSAV